MKKLSREHFFYTSCVFWVNMCLSINLMVIKNPSYVCFYKAYIVRTLSWAHQKQVMCHLDVHAFSPRSHPLSFAISPRSWVVMFVLAPIMNTYSTYHDNIWRPGVLSFATLMMYGGTHVITGWGTDDGNWRTYDFRCLHERQIFMCATWQHVVSHFLYVVRFVCSYKTDNAHESRLFPSHRWDYHIHAQYKYIYDANSYMTWLLGTYMKNAHTYKRV